MYDKIFSQVYQSLTDSQKNQFVSHTDNFGLIEPAGAFLCSAPISTPPVENTDFMSK